MNSKLIIELFANFKQVAFICFSRFLQLLNFQSYQLFWFWLHYLTWFLLPLMRSAEDLVVSVNVYCLYKFCISYLYSWLIHNGQVALLYGADMCCVFSSKHNFHITLRLLLSSLLWDSAVNFVLFLLMNFSFLWVDVRGYDFCCSNTMLCPAVLKCFNNWHIQL